MNSPLHVFPVRQPNIDIITYSDETEGGRSSIDSFDRNENGIAFEYTLRKGIQSPYAGINFKLNANRTFLDVTRFDRITLGIETNHTVSIKILMRYFIENYSRYDVFWSFGVSEKEILVTPEKKLYDLALGSFTVPEWWYLKAPAPVPSFIGPNLRKLSDINIDASIPTVTDRQERLVIRSLFFRKLKPVYSVSLCILLVVFASVFIAWYLKIKNNNGLKPELQGRRKIALTNHKDEDLEKIVDFVKTNYIDPELSAKTIYSRTGINARRINFLIKEKYECTFSRLVNSVRIEEAKRLLFTTDRQVLEIAMAVGFSNIVHFNRVFRNLSGMTPKEFRPKIQPRG
jgi:AraC-like DNA-binding protein